MFIRFETDEAAEKIFQIEPPIEGLVKALSFRDRSSEVTLMYKARDNPTMADRYVVPHNYAITIIAVLERPRRWEVSYFYEKNHICKLYHYR